MKGSLFLFICLLLCSCQSPKWLSDEKYDGELAVIKMQKEVNIDSIFFNGKYFIGHVPLRFLKYQVQPGYYTLKAKYGLDAKIYEIVFFAQARATYYLYFDSTLNPQKLIVDEL